MAAEEMKKAIQAEDLQQIERPVSAKQANVAFEGSIETLKAYGGFQLIKSLNRSLENMDPKRKAAKNIFLSEDRYDETRERLLNELKLWLEIVRQGKGNIDNMIDDCIENRNKAEENLSNNLFILRGDIKKLERAYRSLDSFFANAGQGKVDYLTVMNVNQEDLTIHDSDDTKAVRGALQNDFDRLSLKKHFSLLVLPGYLGDADNVRQWGKTAYENRVLLVTDFDDNEMYDSFDDLKNDIDDANLKGQDTYLSHVIMTCNYLLGRKKSELANEVDDLFIPGSGALAGKLSNVDTKHSGTIISQGIAGVKYGTLDQIKGTRLDLKKSELTSLIDLGVVPMVESDGRTMAFSDRSLYCGGTDILQEYPIVRVFDWIGKMFQHFLDKETFRNWTPTLSDELKTAIHTFLSQQKGPGRLIENYSDLEISQDNITKDITINVNLKPFFAARNYIINLKGHQDEKTNQKSYKSEIM